MNGKLHDVYYLYDTDRDQPVAGTETPWPTVAECHARNLNLLLGEPVYKVEVWTPTQATPFFSQRDPRWKDHPLGGPPNPGGAQTTIGQYGCVITSLAMGLSQLTGEEIYPDHVDEAIKTVDGYSGLNRNLLKWNAVVEAFPYLRLRRYFTCDITAAPIDAIDAALTDGCIVLIKIDFDLTDPDVDSHYLLVVDGQGEHFYTCHDPWPLPKDQRPVQLPPAYCKQGWTASRAIYAGVIFEPA